jgi:DNA repair protein RadC
MTRQIYEAGKVMDIDVLDSMVIGQGKWTSLKERGLGFDKP